MIPLLTPFPFLDQAPPVLAIPDDGKHHTLTGNFRLHKDFHSNFLPDDRDVLIYLPPNYESAPDRRYPVLYLHDGQNLFDGATSFVPGQEWCVDETAQDLINRGRIEPLIVVGVYNTGTRRIDEYTPTRDRRSGHGGRADLYARMLIEELKPFVDNHYRTRSGASDTGLGGSSLGGLTTLYIGLKRSDTFGKLAVLSPSVWWDRRAIIRTVRGLRSKPTQRIWLDTGTAEGSKPERTLDDVRKLRDAMVRKGWNTSRDLAYVEAQGAVHSEPAWAARVGSMLEFLFPAAPHK